MKPFICWFHKKLGSMQCNAEKDPLLICLFKNLIFYGRILASYIENYKDSSNCILVQFESGIEKRKEKKKEKKGCISPISISASLFRLLYKCAYTERYYTSLLKLVK